MKLLIAVLLSLISTGLIYHCYNNSSDNYSGPPYYHTSATSRTPPGPYFGWPVNGSLMLIDYYSAFRITVGIDGQYITKSLWDNIPKHALFISDPNIMVAYAKDSTDPSMQFFLLINQTKWPFLGGGNQTLSFGISGDKIVTTTMAFLNQYPTTYYIPTPY
jgi:hypothetical protein